MDVVQKVSKGPAMDMAEILHCYGTSMVSAQLVGTALSAELISHITSNETNIFRQRTLGSPARDYIPLLRVFEHLKSVAYKMIGSEASSDAKEAAAREYQRLQQVYISDLLAGVKCQIENGDETPSILGKIMRSGALKDEEILLASSTGSECTQFYGMIHANKLRSCCWRQPGILAHLDDRLPRKPP